MSARTRILSIDPGPAKSAWLVYDGERVLHCGIDDNEAVLDMLHKVAPDHLAIESIQSFGMTVGQSVFTTCIWVGRYLQAWGADRTTLVYRKDVKLHLCHSHRAKDANIRQALIDLFPATGGGKVPQIGIKKQPGPLFGVSSHCWSALAVAVVFYEVTLKPGMAGGCGEKGGGGT